MPRYLPGDTAPAEEPRKKRKRGATTTTASVPSDTSVGGNTTAGVPQPSAPQGSPDFVYTAQVAERSADLDQRLAAAEAASQGTLPSTFVFGIANAATDNHEAARAAAIISRQVSIPAPMQLVDGERPVPGQQFTDPLTGEPMTLKRTRRWMRAALIGGLAQQLTRLPGKTVDPSEVLSYFDVMNAALPGRIPAATAIGVAITGARRNMDPQRFAANLNALAAWNRQSKQLTEAEMVQYAALWTERYDDAITTQDILLLGDSEAAQRVAAQVGIAEGVESLNERYPGAVRGSGQTITRAFEIRDQLANSNPYSSRTYALAENIGNTILAEESNRGNGWWERTAFPLISKVLGPVVRAADNATQPFQDEVLKPAWDAFVEGVDAFQAGVYGTFYAGGTLLTGGYLSGGLEQGFRDAWAYGTRQRRWADDLATQAGLEPGSKWHTIVSAGSMFLWGWFVDPLVVGGWMAKARALQRLPGAAATDFTKGTGIFARWADPGISYSNMLDQALDAKVPGRWVLEATEGAEGRALGKSNVSLLDWLAKEKNVDRMVDTPRGLYGLGPGLDRRVAVVIRSYVDEFRKGVVDAETRAGIRDIMRVSLGMQPRTSAGSWARRALDESVIGRTEESINRIVRTTVEGRQVRFGPSGRIAGEQRLALTRTIEKRLTQELGLTRARAQAIAKRAADIRASDVGLSPLAAIGKVRIKVPKTATFTDDIAEITAEVNPDVVTWLDGVMSIQGVQRVIPTLDTVIPHVSFLQPLRDARLGIASSPLWRNRISQRLFHPFFNRAAAPAVNIEQGQLADDMFGAWLHSWGTLTPREVSDLRANFVRIQNLPTSDRELAWMEMVTQSVHQALRSSGLDERFLESLTGEFRRRYRYLQESVNRTYGFLPLRGKDVRRIGTPVWQTELLNTLALPDPIQIRRVVATAYGSVPKVAKKAEKMFGKAVADLDDAQQVELLAAVRRSASLRGAVRDRSGEIAEGFTHFMKQLFVLRPAWTVRVVGIDENARGIVHLASMAERITAVGPFRRLARSRTVTIGDRTFSLRLLDIPDEPSVSNVLDASKAYASIAHQQRSLSQHLGFGGIKPGAKNYWDEYERTMQLVVHQDPLAQRILRALVGDASDGHVYTMDEALEWARANPRRLAMAKAARMDVDDHFQRARDLLVYLTGGSEDVARSVLRGDFSRALAQKFIERKRLPEIASDLVDEIVGGRASLGQRSMGKLFEVMGSRPSAFWNRMPLYRRMVQRELERLFEVARQSGRTFTKAETEAIETAIKKGPTAGGAHPLAEKAHQFAVREVSRIMFSSANRSQFAEAHHLLIPFFGPFEEQFTVWAHLLWENPRIAGRLFETGKLAVESGFFQRDQYGELVMPARVYAPLAILGDWIAGTKGTDWLPSVAGLNTFWGNAFQVPLPGGGHVPLPMPGFNWAVEQALKLWVPPEWENKGGLWASIANYTFAYGDGFSLIPNNYKRIFWALAPMDNEMLQLTTDDILRAAALQGLEVVTEGKAGEGQISYADAKRSAREWLAYRGFVGLFLPTYPSIVMEQDEARTQYFKWLDETNGNYEKADELWRQKYGDAPDSELALIGSHAWARPGPSLPISKEVGDLLKDPDFLRVMNMSPQLALAMLPKEVREGEVDLEVYAQQVAMGLRVLRPPGTETVSEGSGDQRIEINGIIAQHDMNEGWESFWAEDSRYRAALDAAFPKGVPDSEDDPGYTKYLSITDEHKRILGTIEEDHPIWAADPSYGSFEISDPFFKGNMQMLRGVAEAEPDSELGKTKMAAALREYFEGRDEIRKDMYRWNIRNIDTVAAQELGLEGKYKDLVRGLRQEYGEPFDIVYNSMLEGRDLVDIETKGRDHLRSLDPEYQTIYDDWKERWITAGKRIKNAGTDAAEGAGYLARSELALEADAIADRFGDPSLNPMNIWWNDTLDKRERRVYALKAAIKPYVFLTAFERREILGIDTSDEVEEAWVAIARDRLQTERRIAEDKEHEDRYWDEHNKTMERIISTTPGMAQEMHRNRIWTYALDKTLPSTWRAGTEGQAWDALFGFSEEIRRTFNDAEFVDEGEFQDVKNLMIGYIDDLREYSPDFAHHWRTLEGLGYGAGLLDVFIDPYWFLDA